MIKSAMALALVAAAISIPTESQAQFRLGVRQSLNPQPLPPRVFGGQRFGSSVSLNPQPLPPRVLVRGR